MEVDGRQEDFSQLSNRSSQIVSISSRCNPSPQSTHSSVSNIGSMASIEYLDENLFCCCQKPIGKSFVIGCAISQYLYHGTCVNIASELTKHMLEISGNQ